jgi:hypothetical protein
MTTINPSTVRKEYQILCWIRDHDFSLLKVINLDTVQYWARSDKSVEEIGAILQGKPDPRVTGLHLEHGADIPGGGAA